MNRHCNPKKGAEPSLLYTMLPLFLFFFSGISPLYAADEIEQQSQGFGNTYQEALNSALLDSIQQVRGLEAGTTKGLRFDLNVISSTDTSLHVSGKIAPTVETYTQSRGWIKRYTVLEVKKPKNKDDHWQVTIKALIPLYKQVVPDDQRQTIAALPFRTDGAIFSIDKNHSPPSRIAAQLATAIQSALVQSQYYAVLNRHFDKELDQEQYLWTSGEVNPTEASRLGEKLGADFMLLGHIDRFTLNHRKKAFYGASYGAQRAEVELSYLLVESATGKIIWSDQKRWFKTIKKNNNLFTQEDKPHPLADLITRLGHQIATDILKETAPASALAKIREALPPEAQEEMPIPERPPTPAASDEPVSW
ncbi:MAG: hypothetical protein GXP14_05410 [Gammaproteobacteria bacterium]|nr:hypothetical protein [Gammaproteobacteria bacterium]